MMEMEELELLAIKRHEVLRDAATAQPTLERTLCPRNILWVVFLGWYGA